MKSKVDIGNVIVLLYENYKKALEKDYVIKPVSYALYQTWKSIDEIEKPRVEGAKR